MLPKSYYTPSCLPIVVIFNLVFFLNVRQIVPIIAITLNNQFVIWKSKVCNKRPYDILRFRVQSYLLKCLCHFYLNTTYARHVFCNPNPFTFSAAKAKTLKLIMSDLLQSSAYFALNSYFSSIVSTFITAIVPNVCTSFCKFFTTTWAYFYARCFTLCLIPIVTTMVTTPCRIILNSPRRHAELLATLLASKFMVFRHPSSATLDAAKLRGFFGSSRKNFEGLLTLFTCENWSHFVFGLHTTFGAAINIALRGTNLILFLADGADTFFCDFSRFIEAFSTAKLTTRFRWGNGKRFTALFARQCDILFTHGNLSFLCHAIGYSQYRGGITLLPQHYTTNQPPQPLYGHFYTSKKELVK